MECQVIMAALYPCMNMIGCYYSAGSQAAIRQSANASTASMFCLNYCFVPSMEAI